MARTKIFVVTQVRFICSVKRGINGEETVSDQWFFGIGFLDYVDSLFFYLPFSSRGQADKICADSGTTNEDWAKLRDKLQKDHCKPENRPVLVQAWKNYVANSFAQPAVDENRNYGNECGLFDMVDDDEIQGAAP